MARTHRLLDLLQLLRQHKRPVKGSLLASQLGISLRTLYRYIRTLQEQGAPIKGESGIGYILQPGYMLPPLMFSEEEVEALVLGMHWVSKRGDTPLVRQLIMLLLKLQRFYH
nr:HTH domain-containing protein [Candidatus Paracaedibacter acanthamoebae]